MNKVETLNTKKIIILHSEITQHLKTSLEKAILIGELLLKQKEVLKHGSFIKWIADKLPFTDRTARNYIKLFQNKDKLITETVSDLKSAYKLLSEDNQESTGKSFYQLIEEIEFDSFDISVHIRSKVDIEALSGVALNIHTAFKMFPKRTEVIIKHKEHKEAYGYILESETSESVKEFDSRAHKNMYLEVQKERLGCEAAVWILINNFFRNGASIYLAVVESTTKEKFRELYEELKYLVKKKYVLFTYGKAETILDSLNYKKSLIHFHRLGIDFPDENDKPDFIEILSV